MSKENQLTQESLKEQQIINTDFISTAPPPSDKSTVAGIPAAQSTEHREEYIKKWHRSLSILHQGHWDAARHNEKVNLGLGIAIALAATISGTTAFTQLQNDVEFSGINFWLQMGVGVFALAAAALGAVQAFVRPSELAARHKQAAQKFGRLRREIEVLMDVGLPGDPEKREKVLNNLRLLWDTIDEESLPLPKNIYDKAEARYKRKKQMVKH